jgi:hypothetical protein
MGALKRERERKNAARSEEKRLRRATRREAATGGAIAEGGATTSPEGTVSPEGIGPEVPLSGTAENAEGSVGDGES